MLRSKITSTLLLLATAVLSVVWQPGLVAAQTPMPKLPQQAFNTTVSPVTLNLETDEGKAITAQIKIRNNGTMAERIKLTLATFTADETGNKPRLIIPKGDEDYLQWLSFGESEFTVEAGEWKTVPVTFSPPPGAVLSHYYSILVARAEETQYTETTVNAMPAILVLTTINSPNAKRQLGVADFKVKSSVVEYLPQTFTIAIKNDGNVHLPPNGTIFIDGEGKKDVAILPINAAGKVVLPETKRDFEVVWDDGFPVYAPKTDGNAQVKDEKGNQLFGLSFDVSKLTKIRFGKYTAHLLMVYDNGERDVPIESQVSFWVIPWKVLLVAGLLIVILGYGLFSFVANIFRKTK